MGGIFDSIFDNPRRYKWEPDIQKVQNKVVVKQKSEDWPDDQSGLPYKYTKDGIAIKIREDLEKIRFEKEQIVMRMQYDKWSKERDEMERKLKKAEEELEIITKTHLKELRKEMAVYEEKTVIIRSRIIALKNYTLTIGHLRQLLQDIPKENDECIIQVSDGHTYWRNCRFNMLRVLISETIARGMAPQNIDDVEP